MPSHLPTEDDEDDRLILATRRGDTRAFEPLLERHLDFIRAFVALRLPVAHLVHELTHEAFVFAFRHLDRYEPGTSFRAWLRAIAANLIRAEIQRFRREQANELGYAQFQLMEQELQSAAAGSREVEHLVECIEQLPPPMRELLALRYRHEESCPRIAERLEKTETWVWQTLYRLRHQLRQCIQGKLAEEAS